MSSPIRILHLDDDPSDRELVRERLARSSGQFDVAQAATLEEFEAALASAPFDLVLSDLKIGDADGLGVIDIVHARAPGVPVVLVTGTGSEEMAVEAMRRGAADYVVKTPRHLQRLADTVHATLDRKRLELERTRAQEALRESEERLGRVLETLPVGVWIADRHGHVVTVNSAGRLIRAAAKDGRIPGCGGSMGLGADPGESVAAEDGALARAIRRGETCLDEVVEIECHDGMRRTIRSSAVPMRGPDGQIVGGILVGEDITDRMEAEDWRRRQMSELQHASRLIMAGQMAAAMAHEMSQPLAAIGNFVESAVRGIRSRRDAEATPDRAAQGPAGLDRSLELLRLAADQVAHAGEIVRRTLGFLSKGNTPRALLDANEAVRQSTLLVAPDARARGIAIREDLAPGLPPVHADRVQIQEVLTNLLRNAIEAIDEGGCAQRTVTVRTRSDDPARVCVAVSDTGPGIASAARGELFAAFRSRKPSGMGLGLWICRNIVEAHGGEIALLPATEPRTDQPRTESGATFALWLPRAAIPAERTDEHVAPLGHADQGLSGGGRERSASPGRGRSG